MTQPGSFDALLQIRSPRARCVLPTAATFATAVALATLVACGPPPAPKPTILIADPPIGATSAEEGAADTELQRGIAYIKNEKYDEARGHLEQSLLAKPTAEAAYYLGVAHEKLGKRADAEEAYKRALALEASLVEASANLSALYLDDPPRADLAIALLEPLLKNADDARLHQNLALAYGLKGNVEGASKEYDAAIAKGDSAVVRFAYGSMLLDAKQPEKAAVQLKKALDATADDAPLLVTVGRMLGQARAFGDCVKALDRAIKIKGTDAEWFVRRGICRHELKDEDRAIDDYLAAIKIDPKFATAHFYLGLAYAGLHKRQNAIAELDKASKLGGEGPIGKAARERLVTLTRK